MFCCCACRSQPAKALTLQTGLKPVPDLPEPLRTLSGEPTVANKTSELPSWCKAAFVVLTKQARFEMAEPGEKFQVTDVIVDRGLPSRRLALGGFSRDRCFIHYERGGIAHSYLMVLFGVSLEGKAGFLWGGTGFRAETDLEQLRSDIAKGRLKRFGEATVYW